MAIAMPRPLYLVALLVVLALSTAVCVRAFRARDRPGALAFAATMATITIWCSAYALELFAADEATYLLFLRVEYLGAAWVTVAWLVFVLEYTGRGAYVTRERVAALSVVPALTVVAVWTNPMHGLMWAERALPSAGGVAESSLGVGFWAYFGYAYVLQAGSTWFLLDAVLSARDRHRRQASLVLLAAVVPWTFQVVNLLGPSWAPAVNLTPFSFVFSGVVTLAALERYDLLESEPGVNRIADECVVETLDDGVLVADATGGVVDANPTAERFLNASLEELEGRPIDECVPALSDVAAIAEFGTETVSIDGADETRYLELSASTVDTGRDRHSGWVVTLHDVTKRRRRRRRMEILNRVLTRTLQANDGTDGAGGPVTELAAGGDAADRVPANGSATASSTAQARASGSASLQQRARTALEMGDVAKEFEGLLSETVDPDPVDVVPTVQAEAERVGEVFPDVDVVVDAPLGEWAHCGGLFEPSCRALLRYAADCATNVDADADVRVEVSVVDDRTVSVVVSLDSRSPATRATLTDCMDADTSVVPESPQKLSCWLGYWGVERMGGTVSVDADTVTIDLPQVASPH